MITFQTNLASALALARISKKYVFAVWCRTGCSECDRALEIFNSPQVSAVILANFIPFQGQIVVPVPPSAEWLPYANGLHGTSMPLVVLIDPNQPMGQYLLHWGGVTGATVLIKILENQLALHPRPV